MVQYLTWTTGPPQPTAQVTSPTRVHRPEGAWQTRGLPPSPPQSSWSEALVAHTSLGERENLERRLLDRREDVTCLQLQAVFC